MPYRIGTKHVQVETDFSHGYLHVCGDERASQRREHCIVPVEGSRETSDGCTGTWQTEDVHSYEA